jgi:outer membrane immunogenic protein
MFLPNWSAKIEYLYYDLGRVTNYLSPLALTTTESFRDINGKVFSSRALATVGIPTSSTRFNGNIVRVGLSYHFSWGAAPVIASYQ